MSFLKHRPRALSTKLTGSLKRGGKVAVPFVKGALSYHQSAQMFGGLSYYETQADSSNGAIIVIACTTKFAFGTGTHGHDSVHSNDYLLRREPGIATLRETSSKNRQAHTLAMPCNTMVPSKVKATYYALDVRNLHPRTGVPLLAKDKLSALQTIRH